MITDTGIAATVIETVIMTVTEIGHCTLNAALMVTDINVHFCYIGQKLLELPNHLSHHPHYNYRNVEYGGWDNMPGMLYKWS